MYSIFNCSSAAATSASRRFRKFVRREFVLRARALDRADQFARRERFLRAEKKRFDDLREVHESESGKRPSNARKLMRKSPIAIPQRSIRQAPQFAPIAL